MFRLILEAALLIQNTPPSEAPPKSSYNLTPVLIVGGAIFLFTLTLSRMAKRRVSTPAPTAAFERARADQRVKEEVEDLLVQIQQISREEIARLDSKIRVLHQLVLDADQRKKELEALMQGAPSPVPRAASAPASPPRPERPANPLHEEVYRLQDQGKSLPEIGAATGLEKGEIELIFGLRTLK